ncbi:MAG: DUF1801 domain-containing protein [Chloroflexota bacterium]|nr:DUF1801 domain-containing protein [Chloroflexota bacterium]
MKSDAATVADFLLEQPQKLRDALAQIRHMIQTEAPDSREGMQYGGPVYRLRDGTILCGFTAQKHNLAFYVGRVPDEFRESMIQAGFSLGKGAVRFMQLDPEKLHILRTLLRDVIAKGITC